MKLIKRFPPLFLGLALAMMIMSACSQGNSSTPPSSLTPLQVIQKSTSTMKNLQTSHFDLNVAFQTNGANATGLQVPSNMAFTLQGSGDQSIPDKEQKMDLTLTFPNQLTKISDVITSDKVYIKTAQGQWYSIDKAKYEQVSSSLLTGLSGIPIDQNHLLNLIEHVDVTDHGAENLNGQSLRHITANMDKAALEQLVSDNPQLKSAFGSQNLNAVKNFSAAANVYIDEQQFYIHRTELRVNLGTDVNGTAASSNIDLTVNLSNFNQPVTITAPANATPLTDPKQVLNGINGL